MTILGFRAASLGLLTLLFSFLAHGEGTGIKVALITDSAGKNDKSFNESAYRGLLRVEKELGAQIKVVEAPDNNAYETLLRSLSEKKYDLIISIGFLQRDAIR
jgi:basic membrane protein A